MHGSNFWVVGNGNVGDFSGNFRVPDWQDPDCTSGIYANGYLDDASPPGISIAGRRLAALVAGHAQLGDRTLTIGPSNGAGHELPYICDGENVKQLSLAKTQAIFATELPNLGIGKAGYSAGTLQPALSGGPNPASHGMDEYDFKFQGLAIYDAPDKMVVPGGVFARGVNVGQGAALTADGGFPDPHLLDPKDDPHGYPNTQTLGAKYDTLGAEGNLYAPDGLVVKGALRLKGAFLYVNGDLFIGDGLTGVGAVVASGGIYAHGTVNVIPDASGLSLEAGGGIFLNVGR
jgi:hypothetical protein